MVHFFTNWTQQQQILTLFSPQTASSSLNPPLFFQNFGKIPHNKSMEFSACSASLMSELIWSTPFSNFSNCSPWSSNMTRVLMPESLASSHMFFMRLVESRDWSVTSLHFSWRLSSSVRGGGGGPCGSSAAMLMSSQQRLSTELSKVDLYWSSQEEGRNV